MTINDPQAFMAGIWDWGFLDSCFHSTAMTPTDIDGFIERNGHFFVIETKKRDTKIPTGQMIVFRQFVRQGHHVLIIWGRQSEVKHDLLLLLPSEDRRYKDVGKDKIVNIVKAWFKWADNPIPDSA